MKVLQVLLSVLTVCHGVIFFEKDVAEIKLIGRLIFFIAYSLFVVSHYPYFIEQPIYIVASLLTHVVGITNYSWILITKGKLIVDHILTDINLLTPSHCRKIILYICFVLFLLIVQWFGYAYYFYNSVLYRLNNGGNLIVFDSSFNLLIQAIFQPCFRWGSFSSVIYGVIYFQMHLKHDKIIDQLRMKKVNSFCVIYKALTKIETDFEYFDNLFSSIPALRLVHIFLSMTGTIHFINQTGYQLMLFAVLFDEFVCWILVYVFINVCHSKIYKKIYRIKYSIAVYDRTDDTRGHTIQLLDQMANVQVTAGHLIKLDTGLILPFIGSICTYTFLFFDKFK